MKEVATEKTKDKIVYIPTSFEVFEKVKKEIVEAESEILLEYFSAKISVMFCQMVDLLLEKVKAGVKVRLLLDGMGVFFIMNRKYKNALKTLGIEVRYFNPLFGKCGVSFSKRNHIKAAVFDGKRAVIGGMNLADKYVNEIEVCGHWKESGVFLEGQAAEAVKKSFEDDYINNGTPKGMSAHGFVKNGISIADKNLTDEYLQMIDGAKKGIDITTPYFVPPTFAFESLKGAAKRGVKVNVIIPSRPDKRVVYYVTERFCAKAVKEGINVYIYDRGFIHQKVMQTDGKVASVGSLNFDNRSLDKFIEGNIVSEDIEFNKELERDLRDIYASSHLFDGKLSVWEKVMGVIFSAFAKIM